MSEVLPLAGMDRLAEHLPQTWIEEALEATGSASLHQKRLPAEQVVWLVIALALYRHQIDARGVGDAGSGAASCLKESSKKSGAH
ncbi:MAG: transposase domain-containing protein [Proteobacteria bacterium]|nr:transposase domain-containing protein [Pseudomonadota bacterium]